MMPAVFFGLAGYLGPKGHHVTAETLYIVIKTLEGGGSVETK
jgi:hypothetical protein